MRLAAVYSSTVPSVAQHQPPMQRERRRALLQQRVVERAQRERCRPGCVFTSLPELLQHQLADRVDQVRRIERAALGLATRVGFLEKRVLAEHPHALLDRQILGVQPDRDDEPHEADERLLQLPEADRADPSCRSPPPASSPRSSAPSLRRRSPLRRRSTCAPSTPPGAGAGTARSGRDTPRGSRCTRACRS